MNAVEAFKRSFFFHISSVGMRGVIMGFRLKYFGIVAQLVLNYEYDLHFGATAGGSSGLFSNGPRWTDFHIDFSILGFGVKAEFASITGVRKPIVMRAVAEESKAEAAQVNPGAVSMDDGIIRS